MITDPVTNKTAISVTYLQIFEVFAYCGKPAARPELAKARDDDHEEFRKVMQGNFGAQVRWLLEANGCTTIWGVCALPYSDVQLPVNLSGRLKWVLEAI